MVATGEINSVTGARPVTDETETYWLLDAPPGEHSGEWAWDDVSGVWLKASRVKEVRAEEIARMRERDFYVPALESERWGHSVRAPLATTRVGTNKGRI